MMSRVTFKIEDSVYGAEIYIVCGPHDYYEHFVKEKYKVTDRPGKGIIGRHVRLTTKRGVEHNIIWIRRFSRRTYDLQTVAHEVLHCAFDILQRRGLRLTIASEEAYAYYFDHLYGRVLKVLH